MRIESGAPLRHRLDRGVLRQYQDRPLRKAATQRDQFVDQFFSRRVGDGVARAMAGPQRGIEARRVYDDDGSLRRRQAAGDAEPGHAAADDHDGAAFGCRGGRC